MCNAGFNTLDSVYVYPSLGGSFSYNGDFGYCGSNGTSLTLFLNNCSTPNSPFSNSYTLTDIGNNLFTFSTTADSVVLPVLMSGDYILTALNNENNCISTDTFSISSNALISNVISTNVSSLGASDGSFTVSISNGVLPYTLYYVPLTSSGKFIF